MGALLPERAQHYASNLSEASHPGDHFSIASAEEGIGHLIDTAAGHGLDTAALEALHRLIGVALDRQYGADGLSRLSELLSAIH